MDATANVTFLDQLLKLVSSANTFLWGPYCLISLLCLTGLYFTIILKGVRYRNSAQGLNVFLAIFPCLEQPQARMG